ncbi:MAG: hypothetical protein WAN70_12695, partial [Terriglobales bacterium]
NPELKAGASLVISAVPVDFTAPPPDTSLDKQVQTVADRVTEIIMASMVPETAQPGDGHAASHSSRKVQSNH